MKWKVVKQLNETGEHEATHVIPNDSDHVVAADCECGVRQEPNLIPLYIHRAAN